MAYIMEVTGTYSEVDGQRALYVTGYLKKYVDSERPG
jgi:hypothetical protein